jgi:hypothetical protein
VHDERSGGPGAGGEFRQPDDQRPGHSVASPGFAVAEEQLIAANLKLTDTEATKFWPIYDQYVAELSKVNNDKYAVVKEYANNYGTLTDAQALDLTKRLLAVDNAVAQLRTKYVPIVNGVLPGVKTATFFQIDRRLTMLIDIQLASSLPLIQSQTAQ